MNKRIDVIVLQENLISTQICCTAAPKEAKAREAEIIARTPPSGTSLGWQINWNTKPVKCADIKGRWHYVLLC